MFNKHLTQIPPFHCLLFLGSNSQETWSREFASWRSVIGQHEKLLENWKNTLVGFTFGAGGFSFCLDKGRIFYFWRVP